VNWLKKLTGRLNGANSRSSPSAEQTNLLEQSEWMKKSNQSVELTVETNEFLLYQTSADHSDFETPKAQSKIFGIDSRTEVNNYE